jgi:chemotaxis protein MotB
MAARREASKPGAPAWMVSFGDMMTLILTFFILLVSLSKEQQVGLVAKGLGSFLVALRSFGLPGVLDDSEEASIFEGVRRRFNLPPEEDPRRRPELMVDASSKELVRATLARGLAPHHELTQPSVALFSPGSAVLTEEARNYLDLLAFTLRPGPGQVLQLEGHSYDSGPDGWGSDRWLAFARARAVEEYLLEEHGFPASRVLARAWATEIDGKGPGTRSVDARLVIPDDTD